MREKSVRRSGGRFWTCRCTCGGAGRFNLNAILEYAMGILRSFDTLNIGIFMLEFNHIPSMVYAMASQPQGNPKNPSVDSTPAQNKTPHHSPQPPLNPPSGRPPRTLTAPHPHPQHKKQIPPNRLSSVVMAALLDLASVHMKWWVGQRDPPDRVQVQSTCATVSMAAPYHPSTAPSNPSHCKPWCRSPVHLAFQPESCSKSVSALGRAASKSEHAVHDRGSQPRRRLRCRRP